MSVQVLLNGKDAAMVLTWIIPEWRALCKGSTVYWIK